MNTLNVIKLLNSKIFHDLGNSITALSMLGNFDKTQDSLVQDLIFHFRTLREIFIEVDSSIDSSSCYETLTQYFKNRKITIKNFSLDSEHNFSSDQYQLLLTIVICLATSISYCGNIIIDFHYDGFEIVATGNNTVNFSIKEILDNEAQDLNTNNIIAYFAALLAEDMKANIQLSCSGKNTIAAKVIFGTI